MVEFDQFKEFYDKHPDLDNTEYYAEFPDANKSTIRSWKARLNKPIASNPPPSEPPKEEAGLDREMVKLLCTQTSTPYNEFEGVDTKAALIVLKAKLKNLQLQALDKPPEQPPKPSSNTPILPNPRPIGSSMRKFGIDPYIIFDGDKNEIRVEIPMDKLLKPEENKEITRELKN